MSPSDRGAYRAGFAVGFISAALVVAALIAGLVIYWIKTDPAPTADFACPVPTRNSYNFLPQGDR